MQRSIFRPESKSKPISRSNSRPPSRDPNSDNDLLTEINFDNLDELISARLSVLLNDNDKQTVAAEKSGEEKVKVKLNSIPEIIKTLQKPLREVTALDRELLLNQLYHLIIKTAELATIYPDEDDYEQDLLLLFRDFQNSKDTSSSEFLLLNRVIATFLIANLDESAVLYSEDKSLNILFLLEKYIQDEKIPANIKQHLIYSYSSINLAIFDGSGGFGVESKVDFLNGVLLGYFNDAEENAKIIAALSYGIGALLTLLVESATLNEYLENLLDPTLFDLLEDSENLEVLKPVAMIFGLAFEIFNYSDDINEDLSDYVATDDYDFPFANKYQLTTRLEELYKNSSKTISKKDKKQGRSLFKDVLSTVELYSDKKQRIKKLSSKKRADDITVDSDIDPEADTLSHIKLSKSRSLAVKSWFAFFRLIQLKWVFSSGLHTHLANNEQISGIVRDKPTKSYSSNFNFDEDNEVELINDDDKRKLNHKKKQKEIDAKRMEKLTISLDQAGLR